MPEILLDLIEILELDQLDCQQVKSYFVGNKARGRISIRVLQENKARQISRKTTISYPLICTRTCGYEGLRFVRFS